MQHHAALDHRLIGKTATYSTVVTLILNKHTADKIAGVVKSLLTKWNIVSNVRVFLRNNAKNITWGATRWSPVRFPLFTYAVMHKDQSGQSAICRRCRNVATHFSVQSWLRESWMSFRQWMIPVQPCRAIIQYVQTRSNSTYHMLKRNEPLSCADEATDNACSR